MRSKRSARIVLSWPERQLRWLERERSVSLWMHGAATRAWVVRLLSVASRLGDGWAWFAVLATVPWVGGSVGTSAAVRLFAVGAVDILIYRIIKRWIARPRPFRECEGIFERVRSLDEFSFPSGHVLHAVACSLILTAYYPVTAWVVWPFTLVIAVSRMILGLHYPSDVIAGAALGAAVAALSFNLL